MTKKHSFMLAAICLGVLSACAATPTKTTAPAPVSAKASDPLQSFTSQAPNVIFSRVHSLPLLLKPRIKIDGKEVVRFKNGEYAELFLEPGEYKIETAYSTVSMQRGYKRFLFVEADQKYAFDIGGKMKGYISGKYGSNLRIDIALSPVDFDAAKAELLKCCTKVALGSK